MGRIFALLLTLALAVVGSAQSKSSKSLDIYFIDTEGGTPRFMFPPPANRFSWIPAAPAAAIPTVSWLRLKRPA